MTNNFITKNISYSIKNKVIINNISIEISNENITGFIGPNGAGKTTFFHILAGLIKPSKGHVFLNNINISDLPTYKRLDNGIAFLPQNSSIFQQLSVRENILSGLDFNKSVDKETKLQRLNELLDQFNLHEIQHTYGINLSGGERRKVELARCLIMKPKFILLDEPFAGIDPVTIKETQQMLKTIKASGTGVLISDHNAADTLKICKTIYLLYKGEILIKDTPKNIAKNELAKTLYFGENELD